jgi:hypothetical protein
MDESVLVLRMFERIIAVLIGGFSIYLGYRLFFHLPFERSKDKGELELPGVKIVLSRVGPGVFFALFGTLVLYYSMTNPVKVGSGNHSFIGASSALTQPNSKTPVTATPQQRSKALTSIEILNCAERLLREQADEELDIKFAVAIRDAKRALLQSVWNTDDWGPIARFTLSGPAEDAPLELRIGYNSVYGDCPK